MIVRIHHVQITVPKGTEDEARRFYRETLGLEEVPKPEALRSRGGFWLERGGFQIHVGTEDGIDRLASKAHVAYQVTGIAAWRARLEQLGISTQSGPQAPGQTRFEIRDPFGNRIEFLEPDPS